MGTSVQVARCFYNSICTYLHIHIIIYMLVIFNIYKHTHGNRIIFCTKSHNKCLVFILLLNPNKTFKVDNFQRSNEIIILLTIAKEYLRKCVNCGLHRNSTLSVIAHPSFTIHHRRRKSIITRNASNFERAKLRGRMQGMP